MDKVMRGGVCFFCHDGKGKYLIGKRAKTLSREPGTWGPAAGGIEYGESVEDALRREMKEEYNAEPLEMEFMGYRTWINDEKHHMFMFDFRVLVDPTKVVNNEPESCEEIRWLKLKELESFDETWHPQLKIFMEKNKAWLK